jgi:hypothetical protein
VSDFGAVQLEWFIKDRVMCGMPVIDAAKRLLGISPVQIWPISRNHLTSMAPNCSHITLVERTQMKKPPGNLEIRFLKMTNYNGGQLTLEQWGHNEEYVTISVYNDLAIKIMKNRKSDLPEVARQTNFIYFIHVKIIQYFLRAIY